MEVTFGEIYEDRLFPSVMKSISRFAAPCNGHGQHFASRTGLLGWEYKMEFDSESGLCK